MDYHGEPVKCWACGCEDAVLEQRAEGEDDFHAAPLGQVSLQIWPNGWWYFECRCCGIEWEPDDGTEWGLVSWLGCSNSPAVADEIIRLRARIAEAEDIIRFAIVELMTPDQIGKWAGVRAWQESA